ncbi:MAG: hypothetical protein ACQETO_01325 [Pseudomonadota bacterium]
MKLEQILLDPSAVYETPQRVVDDASLEKADKIRVLHHWEYDARRVLDSEGEGMDKGDASTVLQSVLEALESLGSGPGEE